MKLCICEKLWERHKCGNAFVLKYKAEMLDLDGSPFKPLAMSSDLPHTTDPYAHVELKKLLLLIMKVL